MNKILGLIRTEIENFNTKWIEITPGYTFNQAQTLRKIELYYNGKFESGEFDSEGFKKFFYNIVQFPCDVATKAIDLDTKDFRLVPESPSAQIPTWFLGKELKDWMKETKFGSVLNEIVEDLPKYGTVVVKKTKNGLEVLNLHNLICDQSVKDLKDSFVLERHVMTADELRAMPYDKKAIKKVIDLYSKNSEENQIIVWERWGYRNTDEDEFDYTLDIVAGVEKFEEDKNTKDRMELGEVLFSEAIDQKKFPYREVHWKKIKGRWLGLGVVEANFDPQIRQNELQNLKSKALYWTSKILFQSQDETIARNLLTDVVNGEILRVKSPLTEIPIRKSDLAEFSQEEQRWDKNVQERNFTFETETGASLPSGTPFRLGALLKGASGGFFNYKREKVGLFLRDMFFEVIIPEFKKSKRKKHTITFGSDDKTRQDLIDRAAELLLTTRIDDIVIKTGFAPDITEVEKEREVIRNTLKAHKNLFVEIPDSFYENAMFSMELIITDEQIDIGQKLESISSFIQLIAGNPQALEDERVRNLIVTGMNMAGINPTELNIDKPTQQMPQQLPQGMPQMPQGMGTPQMMTNEQAI